MAEASLRVAIAGEDSAHFLLASRIGAAVQAKVGSVGDRWTWVGDGRGGAYLPTTDLAARPKAASGRPQYRSQRVDGRPKGFGAVVDAIAQRLSREAELVVVLFDEDGDGERRASVERVLPTLSTPDFVVGWCVPVAEAWLVAFIGPQRPARLAQVERDLQRKVASQPESMCSRPAIAPHHAKRVLNFLLDEEIDAVVDAGAHTPPFSETEGFLSEIDLRGVERMVGCGIGAFVRDLEEAMKRPSP